MPLVISTVHTRSYIQEHFHLALFHTCHANARIDMANDRQECDHANCHKTQQKNAPVMYLIFNKFVRRVIFFHDRLTNRRFKCIIRVSWLVCLFRVIADVTLYMLDSAMSLLWFTTHFTWNDTRSWGGELALHISLVIDPCSLSHMTTCRKCSWTS